MACSINRYTEWRELSWDWSNIRSTQRFGRGNDRSPELYPLRPVGGGYIFTHRLLREYFVSLAGSKDDSEKAINGVLAG